MRVLAITQIWPNVAEPTRAAFNLQQFKRLGQHCDLTVLSALAHFPGASFLPARVRPARAASLSGVPARESIEGIDTRHMRQLYLPRVGVPIAVPLYLASLFPHRA